MRSLRRLKGADELRPQGLSLCPGGVVRVREGGEITDRIKVGNHGYAVMLGGPERKHLFICTSDTHDPAEIHRNPSASFQVVEVDVAGAGMP